MMTSMHELGTLRALLESVLVQVRPVQALEQFQVD